MFDGLKSNVKLSANAKSIFSNVKNKSDLAKVLSYELSLISKRAFKWKMFFKPEPTKTAQKVII